MCLVLNSTAHNRECSEGLTVNGLQVITPPHNMYCTGTQGAGYFSHTNKMMTNTHAHTHAYTHTSHTHTARKSTHTHTHTHTHRHTHTHTHRGQYQPRMMWTFVHTRLSSPECDLHVTMSLYRNTGVWLLRPHKQNDDKHAPHAHTQHAHTHTHITHTHTHTHTHIHTQSQELTIAKVNILCIMATIKSSWTIFCPLAPTSTASTGIMWATSRSEDLPQRL